MHRDAVTAAGAELVRMARQAGLVKGEWVAIDGSKFRAVSSTPAVPERESSEALPVSWKTPISRTKSLLMIAQWQPRWKC